MFDREYMNSDWGVEAFLQGHTESEEKHRHFDFLIPLVLEDVLPMNLPKVVQARLKAKLYIDARKLEKPKEIEMFQKRLLFAMPKVPLNKCSRVQNNGLRLKGNRVKLPPLYQRVYKYDKWNRANAAAGVPKQRAAEVGPNTANQEGKPVVKRANIEVDPEDPDYDISNDQVNIYMDDSSDDDGGYKDNNNGSDDDDCSYVHSSDDDSDHFLQNNQIKVQVEVH